MLAPRSICAACRSRLAASLARPLGHGHGHRSADGSRHLSTTQPPQNGFSWAAPASESSQTRPRNPRTQRGGTPASRAKNRALDLFESTVNATHKSEAFAADTAAKPDAEPTLDIDQLFRYANRLRSALKAEKQGTATPEHTAEACLAIVVDNILEATSGADRRSLPRAVQQACEMVMKRVLQVKFSYHGAGLPSAAALCKVLAELGLKSPGRLDPYTALLDHLAAGAQDDIPFDQASLESLLECWEDVAVMRRTPSGDASAPPRRRHKDPVEDLRHDFPGLVRDGGVKLVIALVATYSVLHDPRAASLQQKPSFEASTATLDTLIRRLDPTKLEPCFTGHPDLWKLVSPTVTHLIEENPPPPETPKRVPIEMLPAGQISYAAWHKRLDFLFASNDKTGLLACWDELVNPRNDPNRPAKLRQLPELFDFIIYQCCSKYGAGRGPYRDLNEKATLYMKSIGLQPTLKTFTAMMEGWKVARRFDRINALWNQLTASKVVLDQHIWSSRISACGALGQPYDGVRALEQMHQLWADAQTSKDPAVRAAAVRPGTASVNAAVSGLLRADNLDAVQVVLAWAAEKKIEPDVYTYNTMLAYMIKRGQAEEADRLLASMKARGVSPDGATFTIILDTAMVEINAQTPDQQRATIARIFEDMQACGLTPNLETYAKMLHVVVRRDDDAPVARGHTDTAIEAILAHLRRAGQQLSPEICTILFEFHAARGTPRDHEAIRALIAERRTRTRFLPDRVFWETVMRHFVHQGDVRAALDVFYDMDDWGIWPALPVMEHILRALVRDSQWEDARRVVETVRAQPRPAASDPGGRYWKYAFWAVAREHGLMAEAAPEKGSM
jgi:pentatricopeptide repeat protein